MENMMEEQIIVDMDEPGLGRCKTWAFSQDACLTCGLCSGSCSVAGIDGFDPRKLVRMTVLGIDEQLVESRWPWICTMCGRCDRVCPSGISISTLVRKIRSLRDRKKVPGILHKGLDMALRTGNNLGLPGEDFIFILEDVAEELNEEPGFEDFKVPIDKHGARILTTIHNKLVNTHTDDLKHWWKIFHVAGEDWTVPSDRWEGTNWGLFTGDDEALKTMSGRIVTHMKSLEAKNLLWPE